MGWFGISKTNQIETSGLGFYELRAKLETEWTREDLNPSAQLRVKGTKLYAKNGTWAPDRNLITRGHKFLKAHDVIAQSINTTYGYRYVEGKPIGQLVVEKMLEGIESQNSQLAAPNDPAEGERQKREIFLRFQDLTNVERIIRDINSNLPAAQQVRPNHDPNLASCIALMKPHQSEASMIQGAKLIIEKVTDDFMAHREAALKSQGIEFNGRRPRRAMSEARDFLRSIVKIHTVETDKGPRLIIDGGLSESNALKILAGLDEKGIAPANSQELLRHVRLAQKIHFNGDCLLRFNNDYDLMAGRLCDEKAMTQLDDPKNAKHNDAERTKFPFDLGDIDQYRKTLTEAKTEIHRITQENRAIIRELNLLSYPKDLENPQKRAVLYSALLKNIDALDNVLVTLKDDLPDALHDTYSHIGETIDELAFKAQEYFAHSLSLAEVLEPAEWPEEVKKAEVAAFQMQMPAVQKIRPKEYFDGVAAVHLDWKAKIPSVLYKADDTGRLPLDTLADDFNKRMDGIVNRELHQDKHQLYLDLLNLPRDALSNEEKEMVDAFRKSVAIAIRQSERLIESIERRCKMLGENHSEQAGNADIGGDDNNPVNHLERARLQYVALHHLLFPNVARPPEKNKPEDWDENSELEQSHISLPSSMRGRHPSMMSVSESGDSASQIKIKIIQNEDDPFASGPPVRGANHLRIVREHEESDDSDNDESGSAQNGNRQGGVNDSDSEEQDSFIEKLIDRGTAQGPAKPVHKRRGGLGAANVSIDRMIGQNGDLAAGRNRGEASISLSRAPSHISIHPAGGDKENDRIDNNAIDNAGAANNARLSVVNAQDEEDQREALETLKTNVDADLGMLSDNAREYSLYFSEKQLRMLESYPAIRQTLAGQSSLSDQLEGLGELDLSKLQARQNELSTLAWNYFSGLSILREHVIAISEHDRSAKTRELLERPASWLDKQLARAHSLAYELSAPDTQQRIDSGDSDFYRGALIDKPFLQNLLNSAAGNMAPALTQYAKQASADKNIKIAIEEYGSLLDVVENARSNVMKLLNDADVETAELYGEALISPLHQASRLNAQLLSAFSADKQSENIVRELQHDRRNLQNLRLGISIAMLNGRPPERRRPAPAQN